MHVVIYGRDSCPYCVRAKALAMRIKEKLEGFDYEYIDIIEKGLSKEDLAEIVKRPVQTVPQVIVDGQGIGGYTEFAAFTQENLGNF